MRKNLYIFILIWLSLTISCQLDPFPQDEISSFDKLYAVSENVEAIDFICKPDQSGYIILGNIKTNENSDIIIINVAPDGIQRNFNRINTPFFDEGVKLKINENDNSLVILGHRRTEASQANVQQNILIKTNMEGVPVRAENALAEDSISAEIKVITDDQNTPVQLNDMILLPPHLITVGQIRESPTGRFNKITRIYDWNSVNFSDTSDIDIQMIRQKPDVLNYNNDSKSIKVLEGNSDNAIYVVYGQINRQNQNGTPDAVDSENISWNIYTDIESSTSEPINDIGSDMDEKFGNVLHHSNGKTYIAGNYISEAQDSLFLITKEYTNENNFTDQKIFTFNGYGTIVSSLAEDEDENIIMATVEEGTLNNFSHLLKFSPSGDPIEVPDENKELEIQNIQFPSTGFYDIEKIKCEPNNVVVILSQKEFENNSTAIGLMKIKF
ncbi:MAG: hypothetical protein ACQETL_16220 [Bacteroidota bacterium]